MIWLIWKQHRFEVLVIALALAFMAVYLIRDGLAIGAAYYQVVHGTSVAACQLQQNPSAICSTLQANFFDTYEDPNFDLLPPLILPVLVGIFLGVPLLAREMEQGTFRLIWTQSVTQRRWLLVKVGTQLVITLTVFAIIGAIATWYIAQNGIFGGSGWDNFDVVGAVPLADMAFGLALGIAAGAFTRHTVWANAVTLFGYTAARYVIGVWVRPYYLPPYSTGLFDPYQTTPQTLPGKQDWVTAITWTDHTTGQTLTDDQMRQACGGPAGLFRHLPSAPQPLNPFSCSHAQGWLQTITWQPIDRVWLFQGIESILFFALTAGLLWLTYWWIRTRVS
ncbi:MAG TPA: ABC transporter permease subunit [Ktedonobacteraceae bacterium]|nr:ABC transporter permease subunit [Ktedonobacteraceae bacterium]